MTAAGRSHEYLRCRSRRRIQPQKTCREQQIEESLIISHHLTHRDCVQVAGYNLVYAAYSWVAAVVARQQQLIIPYPGIIIPSASTNARTK